MSLRFFWRKYAYYQSIRRAGSAAGEQVPEEKLLERECAYGVEQNLETAEKILGKSNDIKIHRIQFGPDGVYKGALLFVDGLVGSDHITQSILQPVHRHPFDAEIVDMNRLVDELRASVLCASEIEESTQVSKVISSVLSGNTILFVDGSRRALIIGTKGWDKRSVSEPQSESVVRGPREGFTENLLSNAALIRRRIKSPMLRFEPMTIGKKTVTNVCVGYIQGVIDPKVLETIKYRLEHIDVDAVLDSGYIEEYIEDAPFSVFPTVGYTEKPDVAAGRVLEGRAVILVDGSPFALTAPMLFIESFQTAEDYYVRSFFATFTRILRYLAYFIAIFGPGLYIALTTFHQELIPTRLLFTFANAREGTPFPAFFEALILFFSFEILREAGLRLPRPVGQAISIVGALIMGDAAVSAGLVGAPMVIVIAITAVASFVVPELNDVVTVLVLFVMALGSVLGGYGILLAIWLILIHLASLKSFGVPYFNGFLSYSDLKDSIVRAPLWSMIRRPTDIAKGDERRARFFIPPLRPHENPEEVELEEKP